jgi:hypothetical protein
MEIISLRRLKISSPRQQQVVFTKAEIVIETDSRDLKSWIIDLEGPLTLADYFISNRDIMRLTAEAEDGRIFQGSAFVSRFRINGSIKVVFRGTGPLTPRSL